MPRNPYPDDDDEDYSPPRDRPRRSHRSEHISYRPENHRTASGRSLGNPAEIHIYNRNDAYQDGPMQDNRAERSRPLNRDDRPAAIPQSALSPTYAYPYPIVPGSTPVALPPYDPRYDPRYYDRPRSPRRSHSRHRSRSRSRRRSRSHSSSSSHSHHENRRHHESEESFKKRILADHKREEDEAEEERLRMIQEHDREVERKKKKEEELAKEAVRKAEQKKKDDEDKQKQEWEAYELKRKAKEEKEKQEKKEADEEYKKRFREHLGRLGYAPNQIDAIIEMEKLKVSENGTPGTLVHQPRNSASGHVIPGVQQQVFPKIRRTDISIETLKHYSLKWEYSRDDPDYIIVFREMTERETDILFAHTAKLREGKGTKVLQIEERKGRGREPELLMVRRKSKNERSKSRTRDRSTSRVAAVVLGV